MLAVFPLSKMIREVVGWAEHYVDPGNGQPELFLKTNFKIVV